jgi:hypothetical protein
LLPLFEFSSFSRHKKFMKEIDQSNERKSKKKTK